MMLFFKDLNFGQESALFICKEKDDKDAKATTLIVRPPIIGRFWRDGAITLIPSICRNGHRSFPLMAALTWRQLSFLLRITKMFLNQSRTTLWDERQLQKVPIGILYSA